MPETSTINPSNWRVRVIGRSFERAAASSGDRRTPDAIARRALRSSTRLVDAALELAEQVDCSSFTIQDVLDRANVSLQTFYRHFQGKDELLLAVMEEAISTQTEKWSRTAQRIGDDVGRVRFIVKAPFSRPEMRGSRAIVLEHVRLSLMQHYAPELRAADTSYLMLLAGAIRAAQVSGRFPGVDVEEEAELIMDLVLARYHGLVTGLTQRSHIREGNHVWAACFAALRRNEISSVKSRSGEHGSL